jgi:transposase
VARAKMILLAEQGLSNDEIANSLSTRREIVSRWERRDRLDGFDRPSICANPFGTDAADCPFLP